MKQRGRKSAASRGIFPKPHLVPAAPPPNQPSPPSHLAPEEVQIWRDVVAEYRGTTSSLALLANGLEAHQRARECREAIDKEGMTVEGTAGQLKAHPLLSVERAAWRAFLQTFKALNIKV